jgi:hypothetical protein
MVAELVADQLFRLKTFAVSAHLHQGDALFVIHNVQRLSLKL